MYHNCEKVTPLFKSDKHLNHIVMCVFLYCHLTSYIIYFCMCANTFGKNYLYFVFSSLCVTDNTLKRDHTCAKTRKSHPLTHIDHTKLSTVRANRELKIWLRVRDWVRVRLSNFKAVTFQEPFFFMLVLGRESSSWDEVGMCCDNVKPEN